MNLHTEINQKTRIIFKYLILTTAFFFLFINVGLTGVAENCNFKIPVLNKFKCPNTMYVRKYNVAQGKIDHNSYANSVFQIMNGQRERPVPILENKGQILFYGRAGESGESNATTAFFIALIPGFIVHGLGHNYIGDKKTFKILLITEAISLPIIYFSAIATSADQFEEGKDIPLADAALVVSISAFIISWVYDFVAAPIKVEYAVINHIPENLYTRSCENNYLQISAKIVYPF